MSHDYTSGRISGHIIRLASSMMVSLLSVYGMGLADVYFLSGQNNEATIAALGTASVIFLPLFAVSTAFAHTVSILVAREVGQNDSDQATATISNVFTFGLLFTAIVSFTIFVFLDAIVGSFDISNDAAVEAKRYISLMLPSSLLVTLILMSNFLSRALGDMRSPMVYALISSAVTIGLSYVFIVLLDYGLFGSFMAATVGRILGPALMIRRLLNNSFNATYRLGLVQIGQVLPVCRLYVPILLSNLIVPASALFVMYVLSSYGDAVVAGYTVVIRIASVVFCIVYVIPGAVSPIVSQNYGAMKYDRISKTALTCIVLSFFYVVPVSVCLYLSSNYIVNLFYLTGEAAEILNFYLKFIPMSFIFSCVFACATGILNSIGKQLTSMYLILVRTFFLTVPLVYWAMLLGDASLVLVGEFVSIVVASGIAIFFMNRAIGCLISASD